jgi:hypothetical protein
MQTNVQCGFLDRRIETFDPEILLEVIRDGRFDWQALLIDRHELQEVATILTGRPLELPERGTANFKGPDQASGLTFCESTWMLLSVAAVYVSQPG